MIVLFIILYIILGLIALALIALLIPVRVEIVYGEEFKLLIKYLFLKFDLFEPKEKLKEQEEKATEEAEKEVEKKENKITKLIKERGLKGFLEIIKEILSITSKQVIKIIKKIRVKELDIYTCVGGADASATAMLYGETCAVIYPFAGFVKELCKCKKLGVSVDMDINSENSVVAAECKLSLQPIFAVIHGGKLLIKLLPYLKIFK